MSLLQETTGLGFERVFERSFKHDFDDGFDDGFQAECTNRSWSQEYLQ